MPRRDILSHVHEELQVARNTVSQFIPRQHGPPTRRHLQSQWRTLQHTSHPRHARKLTLTVTRRSALSLRDKAQESDGRVVGRSVCRHIRSRILQPV